MPTAGPSIDAHVVEREDRRSCAGTFPFSFDANAEDGAHRGVGDGRHDRPPRVELGRSHAADATPRYSLGVEPND